jgi:ribosomal protein S18 acetylase RimI-like enzyme
VEHTILPVREDACQEAANVLGRAFIDNPIPVAIFQELPEIEHQKRINVAFAADLEICAKIGKPLLIKEKDSVVAVAVIYHPGSYPMPFMNQISLLIKVIWGAGFYGLGRWMTYLLEIEKLHPKQPHYYMEYLGVEPAYQGKGLGSALLKMLTEKADTEQMGCYLENANPRNNPLYHRFGFETINEKDIIGVHNWFMWRTPNKDVA